MKAWAPLAFYVALLAWWFYIASLALDYPADAAFIFWLVAISGALLTVIRAVAFVRRRVREQERRPAENPASTQVNTPDAPSAGTHSDGPRVTTRTDTAEGSVFSSMGAKRQTRVLLSFVVILIGIQLVGIHIILPLFTAVYLFVWARVRNVFGLVAAFAILFLIIVLIFDYLLVTPWPASVLEDQLGLRWGRFFSGLLP